MRIMYLPLLFAIIYISTIHCKEENVNKANVENLKILRNSVNFAYKAGNHFLDLIRGSTPPHEPFQHALKMFSDKRQFKLNDFVPVFLPFVGFIVLLLLGLMFTVFVLLVGFCFCLCRIFGKCGGRIKGMDPKHATCKRYTYALFLGIISIIQLAGIVLAFINNQLIHDTMTNPSEEISAIKQFAVGSDLLKGSLKNISEAIKNSEKISSSNSNVEIDKTNFSKLTCNRYFSVVKNETDKLNIRDGLGKISSKIEYAVEYFASVKFGVDQLRNYGNKFKAVSKLNIENIRSKVCDMLDKTINKDVEDLKNIMRNQMKNKSQTGAKLQEIVNFLNVTILNNLDYGLSMIDKDLKLEYLEYRMYICIGICCLLLLIVLFYFLGLCFGQCGERPFEDARICNRGVGANLMMAGVAFAFLFTPLIMMIEIFLFMNFAHVQTDFCRYLTNSYEPGVKSIDSILTTIPELKEIEYIKNNILDSVINLCPTEPMAKAFKIDKNLMSQEISGKIAKMNDKIKSLPKETKVHIINGYFKEVESLLLNISSETGMNDRRYDGFDTKTKETINNKLKSISTEINYFSLVSIKENFLKSFDNAATNGFDPALMKKVEELLFNMQLSSYRNVRCDGIYKSAVTVIDAFCVTFLWPFNGFWFGVGICLIFTIPAIIFAVKLVGLYRRTEKYSADYEEPDYHSYMGFYTNNADNIPMKRPKSAKSNSKNRNSNSNNKDSVKQNNPQYLPVYPYDAYE